jgi:hypothetical protein
MIQSCRNNVQALRNNRFSFEKKKIDITFSSRNSVRLSHKIQRQLLREKPYYYSTNAHSSEPTAHARAPTLSWPLIDEKMGEEKLLDGTAEKRREISLHHWDIFSLFFSSFFGRVRERGHQVSRGYTSMYPWCIVHDVNHVDSKFNCVLCALLCGTF